MDRDLRTLNAARQSGGALGVAVFGSLLGRGHALSLQVPLLVATAGYLIAIALAWTTIRGGRERRPSVRDGVQRVRGHLAQLGR